VNPQDLSGLEQADGTPDVRWCERFVVPSWFMAFPLAMVPIDYGRFREGPPTLAGRLFVRASGGSVCAALTGGSEDCPLDRGQSDAPNASLPTGTKNENEVEIEHRTWAPRLCELVFGGGSGHEFC
jgi:hypothetical protein